MADTAYRYIVIGTGLAGGSAVKGIRDRDAEGSLLLIGYEHYLPYHRPPLTKGLWFGKKRLEELFARPQAYYDVQGIDRVHDRRVTRIDRQAHTVTDERGNVYQYEKLLLATGGVPRRLDIPGADLPGISYYRYIDDYLQLRPSMKEGASALIVGGGFIGSELAAALQTNKVQVTMVYRDPYLVSRIFPEGLGRAVQEKYRGKSITILDGDTPTEISRRDGRFVTRTKNGQEITSDSLIVGAGLLPDTTLAEEAGLEVRNGVVVNDLLQTTDPDIYAAGDNARFPYQALGGDRRIEHWDNALNQGKFAGANMAGAQTPYTYMPMFFSDLYDFGYEAVGDVDARLQTVEDWKTANETGVIYYLNEGQVRGAMMCKVWGKVDAARALIQAGEKFANPEDVKGRIAVE